MMLFNGILCLVSGVILLVQMSRVQNSVKNQALQKFIWIYWALLMILAIHHIFTSLVDPWISGFLSGLAPLSDTIVACLGGVLSLYLQRHKNAEEKLT